MLLATLIPANVAIGLLLPTDKDPPLPDFVKGLLEAFVVLASFATFVLLLPVEITGAVAAAAILAVLIAVAGLILAFDDIFKGLDCDFDGDPNDSSDIPGVEC